MFWLKKLVLTTAFVVAGGLVTTGVAVHQGGVAFATDPQAPGGEPKAAPPGKPVEERLDPKAELLRRSERDARRATLAEQLAQMQAQLQAQLEVLRKQAEEITRDQEREKKLSEVPPPPAVRDEEQRLALQLQQALADKRRAEEGVEYARLRLEVLKREKAARGQAKPEMPRVVVTLRKDATEFSIQEFGDGLPFTVTTDDPRALTKILSRIYKDPSGPKALRVVIESETRSLRSGPVIEAIKLSGFPPAEYFIERAK